MKKYHFNFNDKEFYVLTNKDVEHKLKILREAIIFWMENKKFYPKFKDLKVKMTYINETNSFFYECIINESFLIRHGMTNCSEFLEKFN